MNRRLAYIHHTLSSKHMNHSLTCQLWCTEVRKMSVLLFIYGWKNACECTSTLHGSERSSLRVIHLHRCTDCSDGDAPVWMKLTSEVGTRPLMGFIPHLAVYRSRGELTVLALSGWVISSPAAAPAGFLEHGMILEDPAFHAEEHESYVVQSNSRFTETPSLLSKACYNVIHSVILWYSKPRNCLF